MGKNTNRSGAQLCSERIEYLDIAKGVLILLVVYGHAWRAIYSSGILENDILFHFIDDWIYSFHMPAFFFISGIFSIYSLKNSAKNLIAIKIKTIAYPYLLWSFIQSSIQLIMAGKTTHAIDIVDILKIPFIPVMQFWFLYALFFIFILFIAIKQFTESPAIFLGIGILLFILLKFELIPPFPPFIYVANNFIYFAAGISLNNYLLSKKTKNIGDRLLIVTLLFSLLLTSMHFQILNIPAPTWIDPIFSFPGISLVLIVSIIIQKKFHYFSKIFALLGNRSLEIFVAHTIFSAGFRIIITDVIGNEFTIIHLLGATLLGILGPLLTVRAANLLQFRYLFTFPKKHTVLQK